MKNKNINLISTVKIWLTCANIFDFDDIRNIVTFCTFLSQTHHSCHKHITPHLLSILDKCGEPLSHVHIAAKKHATDKCHNVTDAALWCLVPVTSGLSRVVTPRQSQGNRETGEFTMFHLDK